MYPVKKTLVIQIFRAVGLYPAGPLVVFACAVRVAKTPAALAQADAGSIAMAVRRGEAAGTLAVGGGQRAFVPEPGG